MQRPNFIASPHSWLRTQRTSMPAANYASAIERHKRRATWVDRALRVFAVALVLGVLALLFV